jgi:hypothetical protein
MKKLLLIALAWLGCSLGAVHNEREAIQFSQRLIIPAGVTPDCMSNVERLIIEKPAQRPANLENWDDINRVEYESTRNFIKAQLFPAYAPSVTAVQEALQRHGEPLVQALDTIYPSWMELRLTDLLVDREELENKLGRRPTENDIASALKETLKVKLNKEEITDNDISLLNQPHHKALFAARILQKNLNFSAAKSILVFKDEDNEIQEDYEQLLKADIPLLTKGARIAFCPSLNPTTKIEATADITTLFKKLIPNADNQPLQVWATRGQIDHEAQPNVYFHVLPQKKTSRIAYLPAGETMVRVLPINKAALQAQGVPLDAERMPYFIKSVLRETDHLVHDHEGEPIAWVDRLDDTNFYKRYIDETKVTLWRNLAARKIQKFYRKKHAAQSAQVSIAHVDRRKLGGLIDFVQQRQPVNQGIQEPGATGSSSNVAPGGNLSNQQSLLNNGSGCNNNQNLPAPVPQNTHINIPPQQQRVNNGSGSNNNNLNVPVPPHPGIKVPPQQPSNNLQPGLGNNLANGNQPHQGQQNNGQLQHRSKHSCAVPVVLTTLLISTLAATTAAVIHQKRKAALKPAATAPLEELLAARS